MKRVLFYLLMPVLILSCNDPHFDTPYTSVLENFPAATYMESDSTLGVSLWVKLLRHADMFNTINLQASYTCFVPHDDAMRSYLQKKGLAEVSAMDKAAAQLLVRFHTIKGARYSSVDFTNGLMPDSTASGDYLSTRFLDNGGLVQINDEGVIQRTRQVTNAYLHVIDQVLTPITATLWEQLNQPRYTLFSQALQATGWNQPLNTIITSVTTTGGQQINRKFMYTVFAVSDSVYQAMGITTLSALKDSLKANDDVTLPSNALNIYVAYHLLNQQLSFAELSYFAETDKNRSKNYATMASNQLINVSEKNQKILINSLTSFPQGVSLISVNKNCKNGVIHETNHWLPVATPKATRVRWELTNYPDLSYIPFYRKSSATTTQQRIIGASDVTCYRWLSVPESKNGLTYELSGKNESVKIKALSADYLILSLGTFGWVEMQSPAIIAGKYAVFLEHFNPKGAEIGGKLMFILNGNYLGNEVTTIGANKTTDQYLTNTKIGEVTFTNTTTHTLRILAGDNLNSYIDCITFSPL